ncbi:hypothetical protein AB0M02_36680 [Actinoplanes sp. NPDC051861]|uniref:hypothetical protein n=1 Tax=Actinoplanes sp. NPDC051861 TaxID=3155170 RepID=UPI0034333358
MDAVDREQPAGYGEGVSLGPEIRTFSAYGYNLGGPRAWNLFRFSPGDELRTDWYDETDPTHDFPAQSRQSLRARLGTAATGGELALPVLFMETIEVSPPGWTLETSARSSSSYSLPPGSELR